MRNASSDNVDFPSIIDSCESRVSENTDTGRRGCDDGGFGTVGGTEVFCSLSELDF